MSDATEEEQISNGLVQLRYTDEEGNLRDLNAFEMAEVLQGLAELTGRMAKAGAFGDQIPPELRVRPPKEGSFVIEAVLAWAAADPHGAFSVGMGAGGLLTEGVRAGMRILRGDHPKDIDYLDNGNVKVNWRNGRVDEMPKDVWNQLNSMNRPTRRAFRKLMAPMSHDASAMQVRSGDPDETTDELLAREPEAVADRTDYRIAAAEPDDVTEDEETFQAEAQFTNVDFRSAEKWRVTTLHGTRQARIEDREFLKSLDAGMSLHKNDIFDVTIEETRTTKNGRTTKEWTLTRVVRKRRGGDHDDDSPSTEAPPTEHP